VKQFILQRLSEASTWRGGILLLTAAGVTISPELSSAIVSFGLGLAGLLGVVTADKK
jgi:hypothetical protein